MSQDRFVDRHIGPRNSELDYMLKTVGASSLEDLLEQTIPQDIRLKHELELPPALSEQEYLAHIHALGQKNKLFRSLIGRGYYGTCTPPVIQRNIFENATWYTSYTPYQAEISQGRLEALLNFQTMVASLTGLPMANASMLDEAQAAAEAMLMAHRVRAKADIKAGKNIIFIDHDVFPQTRDVMHSRAIPQGIEIVEGSYSQYNFTGKEFAVCVQFPDAKGNINDYRAFAQKAHENKTLVIAIADLLALALYEAPGAWGADVAVGSTQRFGVQIGLGGPSAGYMATTENYKRDIPGRIVGVSVDRLGQQALRLALQTREQHIKRERATSNICTAQALLATMAGMYAVYHGPEGIKRIALNAYHAAHTTAKALKEMGLNVTNSNFFDTIRIIPASQADLEQVRKVALEHKINFYYTHKGAISIAFDELSTTQEVQTVVDIFAQALGKKNISIECIDACCEPIDKNLARSTQYLQEKVFNLYRSETEMMRYIKRLENKDIALNHSMISLGSCTMKLNPAAAMLPMSWPEFGAIHPFAPADQMEGYMEMLHNLEHYLATITHFEAVSLQPNSGAAGEYAAQLVIRQYHIDHGQPQRNIVLIPASAHGTNPASAAMAGHKVVVVQCDEKGYVDVNDLKAKAEQYKDVLSSFMVTYPSTYGIFEARIREMVDIIHRNGGLVYYDGANLNALVGLSAPGYIGADICHLNLHKTFAGPHGGGGPGIGPICASKDLAPYLPGHSMVKTGGDKAIGAVSAAPWGSASLALVNYAYIRMMGTQGLKKASEVAILSANYIVAKLKGHYGIVYTNEKGRVGHETIVDCRKFREKYGIETADIAHRLMDYGFHAPTLSFPVHETLLVEPTESESLQEIDRFCEALIQIWQECEDILHGKADKQDNLLLNAPHTMFETAANDWKHHYSREEAAFPLPWVRLNKFWPSVSKIDNGYGDRNLICTCAPIESYME